MITDLLLDHASLVPAALLATVVVCVGAGVLVLRRARDPRRTAWSLAALALLPVVALTLSPSGKGRGEHAACTVQFALPSLTTVELLANVALLLPAAFFAALATRRPLLVAGLGSAGSAGLEAVQALVPAIGRACDTNDWAMNSLGVLAAALLAGAVLAGTDRASVRG
ncbi:VanZ family protein [Blastococcus sp. SYSU D01042]